MNRNILSRVLLFMDQNDMIRLAQVSKQTHKLVSDYYQKLVVKRDNFNLYCKENRILELCKLIKSEEGMKKRGRSKINWSASIYFYSACCDGHRNLVEFLIKKGAKNWNTGLRGACRGGHRDLVELMIENGATEWNMGLLSSCMGDNQDLVDLMIEKGARRRSI